jgi:Integrase core domain
MKNLPSPFEFLILLFSGWLNRHQAAIIDYLKEENRVLMEQLDGRRLRLTNDQRRRLAVKGTALGRKVLGEVASIVRPDTILAWYRKLVAKKYDGSKNRGPGRPCTQADIAQLVVRMARENPSWGYTRIKGMLHSLSHDIGRNTIKRILKDHGLEPAPTRKTRIPWKEFINAHIKHMTAADFFTVEVLTWRGLVRFHVWFVIKLQTRVVEIAGISPIPCGDWMKQLAKNLTDPVDGFLRDAQYIILDRDPLYTVAFLNLLKDAAVEPLTLPARSPNLNAYAERFVLSIKSECLSKIVPLGEQHLRHAISEYMAHYYMERHHQGLDNQLITPVEEALPDVGKVQKRERLGGMLNFYYREAA